MKAPTIPAVALVACLAGCTSYQYRDRSYKLPEAALNAQQHDLEQEVAEVTPVLKERRLGGSLTVVLPSELELRRVLHPQVKEDEDSRTFYATSLVLNEDKALGDALGKSGLVDSLVHQSVRVMGAASFETVKTDWLVVLAAETGAARTRWLVGKRGAGPLTPVAFDDAARAAKDRMDAFVAAVFDAGRKNAGSAAAAQGSSMPDGWSVVDVPANDPVHCRCAFPRKPEVHSKPFSLGMTWTATAETDELRFDLLASRANKGVAFDAGVEGSRRDELRDALGLEVLEEENDPDGARAKWVLFRVKGSVPEQVVLARILRTARWLPAGYVTGLRARVLDPLVEHGALKARASKYSRVFLDSLSAQDGS